MEQTTKEFIEAKEKKSRNTSENYLQEDRTESESKMQESLAKMKRRSEKFQR